MAGITLTIAQNHLDTLLAAHVALAGGAQSYSIAGRAMTKANLAEIRDSIKFYMELVTRLSRGSGPRVHQIIPL